ncbi:MAG: YdbL family protein [Pseudomonadales bacterium]
MRTLSFYLGVPLLLMLLSGVALGADLDQAKRDGLVGERADGLLGVVVDNSSADIVALVKDINERREAEYVRIAEANNLSMNQVRALAGKKTIEKTRSGDWIFMNGGWKPKE